MRSMVRYVPTLDGLYELLPTARLQVLFRTSDGGPLVGNLGSMLRGAFGAALREISSHSTRMGPSAYRYVFESPRPESSDRLRGQDYVPHPFVLRPPTGIGPRGLLTFELVLIGRGLDYFPEIVSALRLMGARGLGKRRISFALEEIWQRFSSDALMQLVDGGQVIASGRAERLIALPKERQTRSVTLDLLSPVQLVRHGQELTHIDFESLVRALLRRLTALLAFHCEAPVELEFHDVIQASREVELRQSSFEKVRSHRYSARQKREIPQGGVVGRAVYAHYEMGRFMPLLRLGERLHVGKGTAMGNGRYRSQW